MYILIDLNTDIFFPKNIMPWDWPS